MKNPGNVRRIGFWLAGLVVLALLLAVGVWLRGWVQQSRLSSAAESFVARAPEQALQVRGIFEGRAIDTRGDVEAVRRQLEAITRELRLEERPAAWPRARFAMGRLYLALGDYHGARYFLGPSVGGQSPVDPSLDPRSHDSASPAGGDPDVAFARGVTHGELYLQGLRWLRILPAEDADRFRGRIEVEWRDAALASLEWARGQLGKRQAWADAFSLHLHNAERPARTGDTTRYLAGREGSFDDYLLLGRIRAATVRSRAERAASDPRAPGVDAEDRVGGFAESADEAVRRAMVLAPGDPRPYLEACGLWAAMLEIALVAGSRVEVPAHRARAEVACGDGLRVFPDSISLLLEWAALDLVRARVEEEHGGDPAEAKERCRSTAVAVATALGRAGGPPGWRFAPTGGLARELAGAAAARLIELSGEEESRTEPEAAEDMGPTS